ncbi:MAG TPA: S8 family peptidase [Casimicrobiaceae bacterium]|nr:S8 family peptidase [Casimicrobiaceae bacterium]
MVAALTAVSLVASSLASAAPTTKQLTTLRVMLNPASAANGLTAAQQSSLEKLAGASLRFVGTTRTGALDFAVAGPRDELALNNMAKRLRSDRSVLWAEVTSSRSVVAKAKLDGKAAQMPGRKLMVRFAEGVDAKAMLPRLAADAGVPLAIERTLGNVHVLALAQTTTIAHLQAVAKTFEARAEVRYADPVRRVEAYAAPNDPRYAEQWTLASVNAPAAWQLGTGSASVTVAVIDTGILQHPDLEGRVLPGYDMITDADRARDGDARDANPHDEGDWNDDGDCDGAPAQRSFFHGLFIAGQIAANANNGIGITGLDWAAKVLPVRVLGQCGGTSDDIVAGIQWAAGLRVEGAPINTHPAKVINLSLGGIGDCPAAAQEAIDDALALGTVVVAAAGNESDDASLFSPGNCSGVVNVGALARSGDRSGYSNFGKRIDISAPGGDVDTDGRILSLVAQGSTTPGASDYGLGIGTSFAAPLVSGTVSLMLARDPNLTVGQVLTKLQGSSSEFKFGASCVSGFCGSGSLDAGSALASTIPASVNLPKDAVAVVEYYDTLLDHYFITSDTAEIASYDATGLPRWERTGQVFYAWAQASSAPTGVVARNVCRFYAGPQVHIDSHYFTANPTECNTVATTSGGVWTLQNNAAFWVEIPDAQGACRSGTLPVYRFFNNRRDANYRYTIDLSVRRAMVNRAWVPNGAGNNGVAFCSLI